MGSSRWMEDVLYHNGWGPSWVIFSRGTHTRLSLEPVDAVASLGSIGSDHRADQASFFCALLFRSYELASCANTAQKRWNCCEVNLIKPNAVH